jgi:high affinity Mn2+ porin
MLRTLLSFILLLALHIPAFAQKAGSGADQIESAAEPIEGFPTEGTLWGIPVNLHGQTTYINQRYNNFTSSYSGMNSMSDLKSMSYTWSGTLFFGARVAPNTDIYFNPEVFSGVPFSALVGLGGFTNGEANKAAGAHRPSFTLLVLLRVIRLIKKAIKSFWRMKPIKLRKLSVAIALCLLAVSFPRSISLMTAVTLKIPAFSL